MNLVSMIVRAMGNDTLLNLDSLASDVQNMSKFHKIECKAWFCGSDYVKEYIARRAKREAKRRNDLVKEYTDLLLLNANTIKLINEQKPDFLSKVDDSFLCPICNSKLTFKDNLYFCKDCSTRKKGYYDVIDLLGIAKRKNSYTDKLKCACKYYNFRLKYPKEVD